MLLRYSRILTHAELDFILALFATELIQPVSTDLTSAAFLADHPVFAMAANLRTIALLAPVLALSMTAETRSATFPALIFAPAVLTNLRSSTWLAPIFAPSVLTHAFFGCKGYHDGIGINELV